MLAAAGQASWTPESDVMLVGATMDTTNVDATISGDQTVDPAALTAADGVFTQLISAWLSTTSPTNRIFSVPARKGDPIYFSADNGCLFHLFVDDLS